MRGPAAPADRYVADFYCHAAKRVVDPRTKGIENFGVRVLRFANAEVSAALDSVLSRIREN